MSAREQQRPRPRPCACGRPDFLGDHSPAVCDLLPPSCGHVTCIGGDRCDRKPGGAR